MGKPLQLVGEQFGKLTVIEKTKERKGGAVVWLCRCECGNLTKVTTGNLRSGQTKSCGCQKYKGLINYNKEQSEKAAIPIGTRFGKLVVIEDKGYKQQVEGHKRKVYLCKCDCGNTKEYFAYSLKNGNVTSCGCIRSRGEDKITQLLKENNIVFDYDSSLEEFVQETGRRLRFDFIIYNEDKTINRLIEFDGNQHKTGMWGGTWSNLETYEVIHERDELKNSFCLNKGVTLIRIPYNKLNTLTIEDLMSDKYKIQKEKGDD